jgi:hypothetical protein
MYFIIKCMTMSIMDNIANQTQIREYLCNIRSIILHNIHLLFYIAAISTTVAGILHLLMIGPDLKPANFPMEMLLYTDALFIVSGILQIFWCLPMILRMGTKWYIIGLIGTIGLTMLLLLTRIPNGITGIPLEDKNPIALLTEISQFLYIGATILIINCEKRKYILNHKGRCINLPDKTKYKNLLYQLKNNLTSTLKGPTLIGSTKSGINVRNLFQVGQMIPGNQLDATFWTTRGIILRRLGNYDQAIASFDEAIRLDPTNSVYWYQKGASLNMSGRKNKAIELYKIAKSIRSLIPN